MPDMFEEIEITEEEEWPLEDTMDSLDLEYEEEKDKTEEEELETIEF